VLAIPLMLAIGVAATAFLAFAPGAHAAEPLAAAFTKRSYAPGDAARLWVWTSSRSVTVQLFRAGPERVRTRRNDVMNGVPVSAPQHLRLRRAAQSPQTLHVRLFFWPSGVYFARLRTASGAVAFAPFVLRPPLLGGNRVAVVVPTNTWQAYNHRDADGDGVGDTWYASPSVCCVDLTRPFLDRGVPPRFRAYDLAFLRWFARSGHAADFLADDDLERFRTQGALARLYDLIVFPGHHEYVSARTLDLVTAFRNAGGNLIFLSANNFFRRVSRSGDVIRREERWRDVGRPEAALVGVQYVNWNEDRWPNAPLLVVGIRVAPWLFAGTRLENGDRFGKFGIEIDARTQASPPETRLLSIAPDIFGPGQTAEMTYYETANNAKVFAAGVLNFGSWSMTPPVKRMVSNLWARLSRP
jgi:hypothetical protein